MRRSIARAVDAEYDRRSSDGGGDLQRTARYDLDGFRFVTTPFLESPFLPPLAKPSSQCRCVLKERGSPTTSFLTARHRFRDPQGEEGPLVRVQINDTTCNLSHAVLTDSR